MPITTADNPICCPYCRQALIPPPKRQKKCPLCGEVIYFRHSEMEGIKLVLTEDEATEYDEKLFREEQREWKRQLNRELREYKEQGITHVEVMTSGDEDVCEYCQSLEGKPIPIDEAIEAKPLPGKCHGERGRCRCVYTPDVDSMPKPAELSAEDKQVLMQVSQRREAKQAAQSTGCLLPIFVLLFVICSGISLAFRGSL
jgi:hypothetical protein